jgi:hypothetical protein
MANLETKTVKVREIISHFRSGKLVVPEFQREFVWKANKAPPLLDSLYRRCMPELLEQFDGGRGGAGRGDHAAGDPAGAWRRT